MNIENLIPVVWSNQRVLTTAQLAEFYDCAVENIRDNFRKNRDHFVEGKHYFKLEGKLLKAFRDYTENFRPVGTDYTEDFRPVVPARTPSFYLWTERGAARHAKMLSTDKAWEVFEELEDNYFNQKPVVEPAPVVKPDLARVYLIQLSDGTVQIVKIGQSKNIRGRVAKIERETGLNVIDMCFTPLMPRDEARLVEWASQKVLSSRRVKGEFFSVEFSEARATVNRFFELVIAELPNKSANLIADNKF